MSRTSRFFRDDFGGGTAFGLYVFVVMAMVLGLALDTTNGWRNRTWLSSSVDMGAHAGAVAIANKMTSTQIQSEVERVIDTNMPPTLWGDIVQTADVRLASYDPATRTFTGLGTGNDNAVIVAVERSLARGNPVATYLMGFLGINSMNVFDYSAAVFDVNPLCANTDGIYAVDQVTLTSQTDVGAGFCIHSEYQVWLPQQNTFQPGSMVTMTDLSLCGNKCQDSANPGIVAVEAHMVMGDIAARITDAYASFAGPMGTSGDKYDFFHDDPSDPNDAIVAIGNQAALLTELGISTPFNLGDVVTLTHAQFHNLATLPSGLVYEVTCTANGNGPNTLLVFDGATAQIEDAALLTNCSLYFDAGASVVSSVIITTRTNPSGVVTADHNVTLGDPTYACGATERSFIMSMDSVGVPAEFVLSNVTMLVDGDVNVASATSSNPTSWGFSIYATGEVSFASQHTFRSCGNPDDFLTPVPKILRLVEPPQNVAGTAIW